MYTFIFDWKRTLYDPDNKSLIKGALDLLGYLKEKHYRLVLVGKGDQDMYDEVDRLGVKELFSEVIFKDGVKDLALFRPFIEADPKNTIFIGDRVRSELAVGSKLKATTVWLKQGKFANEVPESKDQEPTYTVSSLNKVFVLLQQIFKS